MVLGRVVGQLVATQKDHNFEGRSLLLVQPLEPDSTPRGTAVLAIDSVGAGVGERVLMVLDGRAAQDILGRKPSPVDAAIVGIVDEVDIQNAD
jgi:ethanolamine utilization protein EutN